MVESNNIRYINLIFEICKNTITEFRNAYAIS